MPIDRQIRRYAAYFRGWCQAFGEHETLSPEDRDIHWLLGEQQVGIILPHEMTRSLYREVLGKHHKSPILTISQKCVQVGHFHYHFEDTADASGLVALREVLDNAREFHLFMAYHFMYQPGTRIITLSRRKPLPIIYKEIGPMYIQVT